MDQQQEKQTELSLLLADCRQALFDAIKADEGASSSTRFEVGRAIGLTGRVIEQENAAQVQS